ncbi:hypothetical protein ACG9XR_22120 [Acinetobacter guillouiae]|jgi:hypothetical protein|uniref:hypothetical protein n=1 Tax=Acinetobacter guillouiae TaxID=106649 RepID=UPI001AE9AD54|nr:hypothetical protein [Acinetobacter guillouiae]MBP2544142.1 hypothetical protein [Acinetobacter guillouiae]
MKKIILWFLAVLTIFIFLVLPWFKSTFTKDQVEIEKRDEFIQLLGGAKLEFMGGFTEQAYDSGGYTGPNSHTYTYHECGIAVYKINDQVASYLDKTKGQKEISKYFINLKNNYLKLKNNPRINKDKNSEAYLENKILYLSKYKINNIKDIEYSEEKTGIKYFDKSFLSNEYSSYKYYKYYKYYKPALLIPDFYIGGKIKCLFDNENYFDGRDFEKRVGLWKYIDGKFNRKYPYYFSFYKLNKYEGMISDLNGFYIVTPEGSPVYVIQPKYNRIFKLY